MNYTGGRVISSSDPAPQTDLASEDPPSEPIAPEADKQVPRSRRGLIIIAALSVGLAAALGFLTFYVIQLNAASNLIRDQQQQIDEQKDLIDKKETFGAAMEGLLDTASKFDGLLMGSLIPMGQYQSITNQAWGHRWKSGALDGDTVRVQDAQKKLEDRWSAAQTEASTNTTGTTYESVIDALGGGFVASLMDNPDSLCASDVLACVLFSDPYTVHFDAADGAHPSMNDWTRTGVAYHEFAHVLQETNQEPTAVAAESFDGDWETMADCFALTYLDGWTLDHRVYVSDYEYWDVSIGYGYTCDESQRQVIRDWYAQLGPQLGEISQAG
jgi:hypothetical protein